MDKEKFSFNCGGKNAMKVVVVKTGEKRGNVAHWFASGKKTDDVVEGDITTFFYDGTNGSMPTKIFEKNFTKVEEE
jgi:hypothetical protein